MVRMKHPDPDLHKEIEETIKAIRGASMKAAVPELRAYIKNLNYLEDKEIVGIE